jgi:hypothetical protein
MKVKQVACRKMKTVLSAGILMCTAATADAQTPEKVGTISKRLQDAWTTCLTSSFAIQEKETADPNAAAEPAFQACQTEEDALFTFDAEHGIPRSVDEYAKSQEKQVLLGHTR